MKNLQLLIITILGLPLTIGAQQEPVRINYSEMSYSEIDSRVDVLFIKAAEFGRQKNCLQVFLSGLEILAMEPYMKPGSPQRWKLHGDMGDGFEVLGAHKLALKHKITAYNIFLETYPIPETSPQKYQKHHRFVSGIAESYVNLAQYNSAEVYYRKGVDFAVNHNCGSESAANNNMAYFFLQTKQKDSASIYLDRALLDFDGTDFTMTNIMDNKAILALENKEYDTALYYARANLERAKENTQPYRKVQANIRIAEALLLNGRTSEALPHLKEIDSDLPKVRNYLFLKFEEESLSLWHTYYIQSQDYKQADIYMQKKFRFVDSLSSVTKSYLDDFVEAITLSHIEGMEQDIEMQEIDLKLKKEQLALTSQKANFYWLLFILSLLLVALLILYLRKRTVIHRREQIHLASEKHIAELETKNKTLESEHLKYKLEHKRKDLIDLSLYLSQLRNLNDQVVSGLHSLRKLSPEEQHEGIRTLMMDVSSKLDMDGRKGLIQENIDKVNHEFYSYLTDRYPKLTRQDMELCGLIRLKLSYKEIANLKNIKVESLKTNRQRLRKKLELNSEQGLASFLQDIN